MYYVSTQGVDEHAINVHYYFYFYHGGIQPCTILAVKLMSVFLPEKL